MDTVVTTMTSTEDQLKELEKQALQLQRMAEQEAQAKAAQEAAAQKQAEQAAKEVQAPAQQVAPANNGGQAQKEEPKQEAPKQETPKQETPKQEKKQPEPAPASNAGGVIGKAQQYLGMPYVWGSASPSKGGFDCSGFISYIFGVGRQDVNGYWNSVSKVSSPQPGDLVFFQGTYKAGPSHIGIYVGNGQMIHASDKGIAYGDINSSYNKKHFLGYGRF